MCMCPAVAIKLKRFSLRLQIAFNCCRRAAQTSRVAVVGAQLRIK